MDEHGLDHDAMHPGVDDGLLEPGQVPPEQWVKALAYYKARAGARLLALAAEPRLVIAADTTCVLGDRVIGQPADADDADAMIRSFVDAEHEVLTGVAILPAGPGASRNPNRVIFAERARVHLGSLSDDKIHAYVTSGGWRGKAGGYNLSERLEAGWPIRFTGDVSTIVGLPMRPLLDRLERMALGSL
jgi:septum formation protein